LLRSRSEIADEARVSVGSFYTRFTSKEALLDVLHERYERERSEFLDSAFREADLPQHQLGARARMVVAAIVSLFRSRRGVLRSLILRYWRAPAAASRETLERVDIIITSAEAVLLGARGEIRHRDPDLAVRIAVSTALAACREAIVLRPKTLPGSWEVSDEALTAELGSMLHAYLTTPPSQRVQS
jgi:AcrR family transcriptional regulator